MNSLQLLTIFIAIIRVILVYSQTNPTYWTGPGQYTQTSCPISTCQACPVTQYRSCSGWVSAGTCVACLTYSAFQPMHSGFSGPCRWTCNSGYTLSNGSCVAVSNNTYAVSVGLTILLTASDVESSISTLLGAVAALSECGTCNFASTPVLCTSCSITGTVTQLSEAPQEGDKQASTSPKHCRIVGRKHLAGHSERAAHSQNYPASV